MDVLSPTLAVQVKWNEKTEAKITRPKIQELVGAADNKHAVFFAYTSNLDNPPYTSDALRRRYLAPHIPDTGQWLSMSCQCTRHMRRHPHSAPDQRDTIHTLSLLRLTLSPHVVVHTVYTLRRMPSMSHQHRPRMMFGWCLVMCRPHMRCTSDARRRQYWVQHNPDTARRWSTSCPHIWHTRTQWPRRM